MAQKTIAEQIEDKGISRDLNLDAVEAAYLIELLEFYETENVALLDKLKHIEQYAKEHH